MIVVILRPPPPLPLEDEVLPREVGLGVGGALVAVGTADGARVGAVGLEEVGADVAKVGLSVGPAVHTAGQAQPRFNRQCCPLCGSTRTLSAVPNSCDAYGSAEGMVMCSPNK